MSLRQIGVMLIVGITLFSGTCMANVEVPTLSARVNDYAGLLSADVVGQLEAKLRALEDKTSAQVAILTVSDLQGYDIETFSIEVARAWALGQADTDNGLLITYAVTEDKYRIEIGFGLEGAIPDGKAGDIIRESLRAHASPRDGTDDFVTAFTSAVDEISNIIYTEFEKDPTGEGMRGSDTGGILILIFGAFMVTAVAGLIFGLLGGTLIGGLCGTGIGYLIAPTALGM